MASMSCSPYACKKKSLEIIVKPYDFWSVFLPNKK